MSCAWVSLVVYTAQPFDGHMGVELCGGQAGMPQQFLDDAQVGSAFEEVSGGGMPQTVRAQVGCARHSRNDVVHDGSGLTLVEAPPTAAQQQCAAGLGGGQMRAAEIQPILERPVCRHPEGHRSFLVAFTEYPDQAAGTVGIVDIEPAQLTDPNTGGVQHLHDQAIAQCHRITLGRPRFRRGHSGIGLIPAENGGQHPVGARRSQPRTGIGGEMSGVCQPCCESPCRRSTSSHGGPRSTARGQLRQP